MYKISDQSYLLNSQYKDASNLNARIQLHERFSTNPYGWLCWLFDQLEVSPQCRILELGCGPGSLWSANIERIPAGWEINLSDLSQGMLEEARRNLTGGSHSFRFLSADAQQIPFEDASFDAVLANHMLYHIQDRESALLEIRRVLAPRGRFYASTVGTQHMHELHSLIERTYSDNTFGEGYFLWHNDGTDSFVLENGQAQIEPYFEDVRLSRYNDALEITEADPLIAYIMSGRAASLFSEREKAQFARSVEEELAQLGVVHITKDSGVFTARRGES